MEILFKPLVILIWLWMHCFLLYKVARKNSGVESFALWCLVCLAIFAGLIAYALVTHYIFLFVR